LKKKTNWLLVIVVFAIVAVAVSYFAGVLKPEQLGTIGGVFAQKDVVMEDFKQKQVAYGAQHADAFITYTDKALGYSLKYPIGYQISRDEELEPDITLRIWAESPFSSSEAVIVRTFDQEFTDQDLKETFAELNPSEIVYNYSGVLDGRKIYLFTVEEYLSATNEFFFIKNAVFPDCKTPDGKTYSALLTFAVPEALSEDLDLADYVIYSFKC